MLDHQSASSFHASHALQLPVVADSTPISQTNKTICIPSTTLVTSCSCLLLHTQHLHLKVSKQCATCKHASPSLYLRVVADSPPMPATVSRQQLEDTKASQSLHPHGVSQPQPVPSPQHASPAARDDPEHPTSVAEHEVDTVIAQVNEADRYSLVFDTTLLITSVILSLLISTKQPIPNLCEV